MKKEIPIHDFTEEDTRNVPVRYVQLNTRNDYDYSTPHRHNYFEIFFFTKGGGYHLIDFVKHPVADNSVHIVFPGQVHLLNREPASYGAVVHFARNIYAAQPFITGSQTVIQLLNSFTIFPLENSPREQTELNHVLEQLKDEYLADTVDAEILKAYLHILLIKCIHLLNVKQPNWQDQATGVFNSFQTLVEEGFCNYKLPSYYAGKLAVTERKLNDECKKATGLTVGDYINNRVVLEAKRLLCNSTLTGKEIAFYLGYTDPSYFNRFFKKNAGVTALEFRKSTAAA